MVIIKKCIKCNNELPIDNYYRHKEMKDGHLNKCKSCCKSESAKRYHIKMKDMDFVISERVRNNIRATKKYREGFRQKKEVKSRANRRYRKKYPEKSLARSRYLRYRMKNNIILPIGYHAHHWSYNEKDFLNVIICTSSDHKKAHRNLLYDPDSKYYTTLDGTILDSMEKHLEYLYLFAGLTFNYEFT